MNTKLLKQKILDLAIRGKLVPQDPNDEPASELLKRIRAEKEKLIAEGKIKRSKKAGDKPHYENVPFEIPENWEWATLELVCSKIGSGSTPRGSNYATSGIPFFRSQNVYDDGLVYDDIKFISEEIHQQMKSTEVQPNDILLNITGGSLGRCAVVPSDFERGNVSQHVCILRPILLETQFLHCFILSGYFSQTMKVTGSGREGLPKYNLGKMVIPIPPLNEQTHIVAEINRWFSLISDLKRNESGLNETVKVTKAKVLDLAIHAKLVPQDPNDEPAIELLKRVNPNAAICDTSHYGNLPESWCICKLKDVFDITMGSSPIGDSLNSKHEGIEFHQGKLCFSELYLNKSEIYTDSPTKLAEKHSILLCVRAPVGVINITEREICIGRGLCSLKPKNGIDFMFAFYALQTHKNHFEANATGTTFKAIGGDTIRNEMFALPPYDEQVRIRKKIESLFYELDLISAEL